ncbi:hypothetical protein EDC04DRAFT_2890890 [Pisolithus marmoratus]|nr:hypothetical protein EDC04DRAFT_2890890 [Pisolithus marmoratus]
MATALDDLLDALVVPPAFARYDRITDASTLSDMQAWKSRLLPTLSQLDVSSSPLSTAEQAKLVRVLAPLTVTAPWTSSKSRTLAATLLATISPTPALVTYTLSNVVKPLFAATPHPRLHLATARVLARPADTQDTYHYQPWKDHPGLEEVLRWCILNTQSPTYEQIWPLILPPTMTFLDDYEVPYKVLGIRLISDMLTRVHAELLLRTGVDALLFTSLTNALNHLRDPSTPELIRAAVPTTLQLIDLTTPSLFPNASPFPLATNDTRGASSKNLSISLSPSLHKSLTTRFNRLSTLLSSSILGTVILYSPAAVPSDPAPIVDPFLDPEHATSGSESEPQGAKRSVNAPHPQLVAAAQVLPLAISALGIGTARFLKGIMPVIVGWLALPISNLTADPSEKDGKPSQSQASVDGPFALHLASLHVVKVLIDTCPSRIARWATTITDGLARCWVGCADAASTSTVPPQLGVLQGCLQEVAVELAKACPHVVRNEFTQLLEFDRMLFDGLVGGICTSPGDDPTFGSVVATGNPGSATLETVQGSHQAD